MLTHLFATAHERTALTLWLACVAGSETFERVRRRGRTVNLKVLQPCAFHACGASPLTHLLMMQFMRAQLASNMDDPEATCTRIGIITAKV